MTLILYITDLTCNETLSINRKQKDGKYLIVKDPNKPVIRLYDIPDTTFESEESDGEDEDDIDGKFSMQALTVWHNVTLLTFA